MLNNWVPARTWKQLLKEVQAWDIEPWARVRIASAIEQVQVELGADGHDAVFVPVLLHQRCKAAIKEAGLGAAVTMAQAPASAIQPPSTAQASRANPYTSSAVKVASQAVQSPPPPPPPSDATRPVLQALPGREAALARLEKAFKDERLRFAPSLDQLVDPEHLGGAIAEVVPEGVEILFSKGTTEPERVFCTIAPFGEFEVLNPHLIANPITVEDVRRAQAASDEVRGEQLNAGTFDGSETEAMLDEATLLRGNPFYKGIYHSIVEFGPDAELYLAPCKDLDYFFAAVGEGEKGMVEGRRVLKHRATGDVWLWVRLTDWRHGWLCIDRALWAQLAAPATNVTNAAADMLMDALALVIDPSIMAMLNELLEDTRQRRPIKRLEASARDTLDESGYAWVCRRALARLSVGEEEPDDRAVQVLYDACLQELKIRVFGYEYAQQMEEDGKEDIDAENAELAQVYNTLSHTKRESLWLAGSAWMKCFHYLPTAAEELLEIMIETVVHGKGGAGERMEALWHAICDVFKKCADTTLNEIIIACQLSAPAVKEVVMACMDISAKLMAVLEMIDGLRKKKEKREKSDREFKQSGGGALPPGFGSLGGDVTAPEWRNVGVMLARLLIDDPEEPGRPPPPPKPQDEGNKRKDWGITFSYDVSIKEKEPTPEEEAAKPASNEHVIKLAVPAVTKIRPGKTAGITDEVTLAVTRWGAVVFDTDGPRLVKSVSETRFPPELGADSTTWEISRDGGQTWEDLPADTYSGPEITYVLDPEVDGGQVAIQAYIGKPLRDYGLEGPEQDLEPEPPPAEEGNE